MEIFDTFADLPSNNYYAYPLEWLDLLINFSLNPSKSDLKQLDREQLDRIIEILPKEEAKLQLLIKKEIFSLSDEANVRLNIERYYSSFMVLLDTAQENASITKRDEIQPVYGDVVATINNLLSFLEANFLKYLHLDLKVPSTYLAISRQSLISRIVILKQSADRYENLGRLKSIIFETLYKFTIPAKSNFEITFRSLFYNKELVRRLEAINWNFEENDVLEQINDVLFYMNFNSRSYIDFIINLIQEKSKNEAGTAEQIKVLHYFSKAFSQSHTRSGVVLNPDYNELGPVLQKWIESEIRYLEEKGKLDESSKDQTAVRKKVHPPEVKVEDKIRCSLSSDQMGLILRAADETRILVARSMTEVFRSIVPFLATPHNDNLSYNGMRSKSYVPEGTDKEKAIEALELMIKKIKDY